VVQSRLDDRVIIGPFARLRPDNHLKAGARIGNFVELKRARLAKAPKGDASLLSGRREDRREEQHRRPGPSPAITTVSTNIRLPSETKFSLQRYGTCSARARRRRRFTLPPVRPSRKNVPSDGLGIARGRQVNKPGWAAKKRANWAAAEKPKKSSSKRKPRRTFEKRKR